VEKRRAGSRRSGMGERGAEVLRPYEGVSTENQVRDPVLPETVEILKPMEGSSITRERLIQKQTSAVDCLEADDSSLKR
jgi:hypothetical protein